MRLTKYTGHSLLLISWTKAELTASSDTAGYTTIGRLGLGFWMTLGDGKNSLSWPKIPSHVSFQLNFDVFRSICAMGLIRSASRGTNLDSVVNRPSSCWTSFKFFRLLISVITLHLSGLASIPLWVSINPRNLPPSTPNAHFSGLRHMLLLRRASKTSYKSLMCWPHESNLTTMSST